MKLQLFAVIIAAVGTIVYFATQQDSATKNSKPTPEVVNNSAKSNSAIEANIKTSEEASEEVVKTKPKNFKVAKPAATTKPVAIRTAKPVKVATEAVVDEVKTQNSATVTTVGTVETKETTASKPGFAGSAEVNINTDFKSINDDSKRTGSSFSFNPRYNLSEDYSLRASFAIDKGLSQGYEDQIRDTRIGVAKSAIKLGEKLVLAPNITATLPTSEVSKRNQEMIAALEINPTLAYTANNLLSFTYTPRYRKYFHEYETSRTNAVNTDYSASQTFSMAYALSDKWTAGVVFIHAISWSYAGTRRDPNFLSIGELSYALAKNASVAMGAITGGALYQVERGPDQTVEVFNENTTSLYTNIGITF